MFVSCIHICRVTTTRQTLVQWNRHVYSCFVFDSSLKSHRKRRQVIERIVFHVESRCTKFRQLAKSNVKDVISTINVDANKSVDKLIIPGRTGRNALPRNVMQTYFDPFWGFSSKKHTQKAREFHCLNMIFICWTLLLVDLTMASNNSAHAGIYAIINCLCSFPVWCLGQDVEFDCICSCQLPFHLLWTRQ